MKAVGIQQRYKHTRDEVIRQCQQIGRDPSHVQLIAVSKTVGVEGVREAFNAGAQDFGENRPDQIIEKFSALPQVRWHFIGNIQSRRISDIVSASTLIHSLFKYDHVGKINSAAAALQKVQDVLIEVNVSGETSKGGLKVDEVRDFVMSCAEFDHVRLRGLMTMAPQGDPVRAKEVFTDLAALKDDLCAVLDADRARYFDGLSMGMSEDWREAVCAGATMVRIGRAIFSDGFE